MTDKQIIFKCDVDCKRKNTEECFELDCIKGQESILKQLKAKEQECERLKEDEKSLLNVIDDLQSKKNKWAEMYSDLGQDFDQLKAENEELKGIRDRNFLHALEEQKKADKLKQTLTEIKEIAEKQYHTKLVDKDCINCDESFAQILQKCEVLNVR